MNAIQDAGFDDVLEWADHVVRLTNGVCQDCGERCGWHLNDIDESLVLIVPELVSEIQRLRAARCTCPDFLSYWFPSERYEKCPVHGGAQS